jgi:tripartite-type tricarboxylate transporter receptor subunit TctC
MCSNIANGDGAKSPLRDSPVTDEREAAEFRKRWRARSGAARARTRRTLRCHGKQPAIVENRPGAGGNLGADSVAKAQPDGYTLLLTASGPLVINPSLLTNTPFDPQKDFEPIAVVYTTPIVLTAASSFPGQSVTELVKYIQQQRGKHNFASGGIGTPPHLLGEVFKQRAGLDVLHVPYRGGGDMTLAVVRGDATFSFNGLLVMPLVEKGEMKVLAVAAARRTMLAPSIPTMDEAGYPGIEGEGWGGLLAPRNTPESVQSKLYDDVGKVLADPAVKSKINQIGVEPIGSTAAELRARISKELVYWAEAIKAAQLRPQ